MSEELGVISEEFLLRQAAQASQEAEKGVAELSDDDLEKVTGGVGNCIVRS